MVPAWFKNSVWAELPLASPEVAASESGSTAPVLGSIVANADRPL